MSTSAWHDNYVWHDMNPWVEICMRHASRNYMLSFLGNNDQLELLPEQGNKDGELKVGKLHCYVFRSQADFMHMAREQL